MKLNEIRDNKGAHKKKMTVGRVIGSGKGTPCGGGGKGQKARPGVSIRGFEGGQMPVHRRLPKRGFKNVFARDFSEVNLDRLQKAVDEGRLDAKQAITSEILMDSGVAARARHGVRVLGQGELKAKLQLTIAGASKSAIAAIEKVGGSVTLTEKPKAKPEEKAS